MKTLMLLLLLIPAVAGAALPFLRLSRKKNLILTGAVLLLCAALSLVLLFQGELSMVLFSMTEKLVVSLKLDLLSKIFLSLSAFGFPLAGFFVRKMLSPTRASLLSVQKAKKRRQDTGICCVLSALALRGARAHALYFSPPL